MVQSSSDYSNKKLQNQEKNCYICGKLGHSKYNCKERESVKGMGRKIIDPRLITSPYYLNTIIGGIPYADDLNFNELGKVLMAPIRISYTHYEMTRAWPQSTERSDEIRITFMDEATKTKFSRFYGNWPTKYYMNACEYEKSEPLAMKYGRETFFVKFRDELHPMLEELLEKTLKLKKEFEGLQVSFDWTEDKVQVKRGRDFWILENTKDIHRLRVTLEIIEKTGEQCSRMKKPYYNIPSRFLIE